MSKLVLLLLLVASNAFAETWLTIPLASYHFDRHRGYNEINLGAGVEHDLTEDLRFAAGVYRNSIRKDSYYLGGAYLPWSIGSVKLGTAFGLVTGYGRPIPLATPTLVFEGKEWGLNVLLIPPLEGKSGGIAFQVKRRF